MTPRFVRTYPIFVFFAATTCAQGTESASCSTAACSGHTLEISFIGNDGGSVTPSGQIRETHDSVLPANFDCNLALGESDNVHGCVDNVLRLYWLFVLSDNTELDVRFNLEDGSFSEWQRVSLQLFPHTIADFNGPGCPCTYNEGVAAPVLVPPDAR